MTLLALGASGLQVEQLQLALDCAPDGEFGNGTAAAMRTWQKSKDLPQSGECSDLEWVDLTGRKLPTLFERCLAVTSRIEGHGWATPKVLPGETWITAGLIGFTTKFKSLNRVFEVAGADKTALALRPDLEFSPGQKDEITRILTSDAGKVAQVEVAREIYWARALDMAKVSRFEEYPWYVALCFDIAVQNGGVAGGFASIEDAGDRARLLVEALLARVREADLKRVHKREADVKERKSLFLHGAFTVHGRHFRLLNYGLQLHNPELIDIAA